MESIGGMETHLIELSILMISQDWRVCFVTTSNSLNEGARQQLRNAGVEFNEMPVPRGEATKLKKLYWLIKQVWPLKRKSWNVVYTNGQGCLARIFWCIAKKDTRLIHHHHTSADILEQKGWASCYLNILKKVPELIACSEETRHNLINACNQRAVTKLLYLIPDLEIKDEGKELQESITENRKLCFGFIGRLVSTKGIELLCDLSKDSDLEEIEWHIHGEGPDYPPEFFNSYDNVYYHGRYNGVRECRVVHGRLDAVVLFSQHTEGMPLSLIEAMSSGLPWIATNRGGTRELALAENNYEMLKVDFSYQDAKAAVKKLANNIITGLSSREAQQAVYNHNFSRRHVAANWLRYLESENSS